MQSKKPRRVLRVKPNPFSLRDYQYEMIDETISAWQNGYSSVLNQAPTGSGKSICQAELLDRFLKDGKKALVAVHRIEIINQLSMTFQRHTGIVPELVLSGSDPNWDHPLLLAMNQTLANRVNKIPHTLDLYIQDECHHSVAKTYRKIFSALPETCLVSGWTATPYRTNGEGFRDLFNYLTPGPQTHWLIENGYLSKYIYLADPHPMTTHGVGITAGDYNLKQLAAANNEVQLSADILKSYKRHSPGLQAVIFCINIQHSLAIEKAFKEAGIPAAHLDGETPNEERRRIVGKFKQGEIRVLLNVGLFGEGFDVPALDAVIIARPTYSLALFLQMVGRALRPSPGKTARIIDLAGNWERHGLPCDERHWSLDAKGKSDKELASKQQARHSSLPEKRITVGDADLVQLNPEIVRSWRKSLADLIDIQRQQGHSAIWLWHQLRQAVDVPLTAWKELEALLGKKSNWAWHQWRCWTLQHNNPQYIAVRKKWEDKNKQEERSELFTANTSNIDKEDTRNRERYTSAINESLRFFRARSSFVDKMTKNNFIPTKSTLDIANEFSRVTKGVYEARWIAANKYCNLWFEENLENEDFPEFDNNKRFEQWMYLTSVEHGIRKHHMQVKQIILMHGFKQKQEWDLYACYSKLMACIERDVKRIKIKQSKINNYTTDFPPLEANQMITMLKKYQYLLNLESRWIVSMFEESSISSELMAWHILSQRLGFSLEWAEQRHQSIINRLKS